MHDKDEEIGGSPAIQREAASKLRDLSIGWIASADTKAGAILTMEAAILALVVMGGESQTSGLFWAVFIAFLVSTGATCYLASQVIVPRQDPTALDGLLGANSAKREKSVTFYGEGWELPAYRDRIAELTAEDLQYDTCEQAVIIADIAKKKMACVARAQRCFVWNLLALVALALVTHAPLALAPWPIGPSAQSLAPGTAKVSP